MANHPHPVTRFAPSPTGHLHVGGARTALFCWAYAKGRGQGGAGRFVLRIEDTDQARSSEESVRGILEDLLWLGIAWDDGPTVQAEGGPIGGDPRNVGPFFQSQRLKIYNGSIERLIAEGRAYPAFETPEQLTAARKAARAAKRTYIYDRAALRIPEAERAERMRSEEHVVRFRMPDEPITVRDAILGDVTIGPDELDDFVIRKRDGFPTYHLAVVVDDERMGVTHVLRGQEHLVNTPRHVALQRALGFREPVYAHMPLIFNPDGSKMSKRDKDKALRKACREAGVVEAPVHGVDAGEFAAWLKDKQKQLPTDVLRDLASALGVVLPEIDIDDFRRAGYLPEVLCNFIALLGWNPGGDVERFDTDFLAERFDFDRVGKSNAKFDRAKLLAFNGDTIAAMDPAEFLGRWRQWCERYAPEYVGELPADRFALLAEAVRPRSKTLTEAAERGRFVLIGDDAIEYDAKAVNKALRKGDGLSLLGEFAGELDAIEPFDADAIEAAVSSFCERHGLGMGKLAQPLRVAMTGTTVSPPIGVTLAVLGRERVRNRIDRCIETCG